MKLTKVFSIALAACVLLAAASASAQVLVGFQQRFFESYGGGVSGPNSVPCCDITPMNPTPTVDPRTTGQNQGAYFAEYRNKTAMVGDLFGGGTPAALNGDGPAWYGVYNAGTGGVTLNAGRYTTDFSTMLVFPGGNVRKLTLQTNRTVNDLVMRSGGGPGNFVYSALGNTPGQPTFRNATTWTPYPSMAGVLRVTAGPNQFGGTRSIIHDQLASGVDNGSVPGQGNRFNFPLANGPGVPFTAQNVVRRETRSATFAAVTLMTTMQTTGNVIFQGLGTGWFTILPFTTGRVDATAATIGTSVMNFTFRTDVGFNSLMATGMGGVTGTLQLVSGHLLQSRGGINTNQGGTTMTRVVFTPEPSSALVLGAGVLGLLGFVVNDRRRNRG